MDKITNYYLRGIMNIFLSFSGEGRQRFAIKFLDFFNSHGIKCWYDQHELYLGDVLSESIIQKGINKTEYAILIINETFLSRNWPRTEAKVLYERANNDKNIILFPLLWNVTKQQIVNSDVSFLLKFKYQFVNRKTPIEIVSYQIMNRIFHDIILNKYKSITINDIKTHAQALSLPKGLDIFNCLNTLSLIPNTKYEIQASILIIAIKLLGQNTYGQLVENISYRIYNRKKINFDICKILESILIMDYFNYAG